MRALTVIQPWAGLIATGVKLIENRTWKPPAAMLGERIAIHAGAKVWRDTIEDLVDEGLTEHELWTLRSAAIATATLVTYVTHSHQIPEYTAPEQRRWFNGPIGFVLRDVVALPEPVPCKGMLGFWTLPDHVEAKVRAQLSGAA